MDEAREPRLALEEGQHTDVAAIHVQRDARNAARAQRSKFWFLAGAARWLSASASSAISSAPPFLQPCRRGRLKTDRAVIEYPFGSVLKPVDGGGAYVRPSCAHSRRSRWSVQVATCGLLQALWATPTNRGNSRKHRSSKSEIVSAQTAASIPATCAARPGKLLHFQSHPPSRLSARPRLHTGKSEQSTQ